MILLFQNLIQNDAFLTSMLIYYTECNCHPIGAASNDCETHYGCLCNPNFGGDQCSQCADGYFSFPYCERMLSLLNDLHLECAINFFKEN